MHRNMNILSSDLDVLMRTSQTLEINVETEYDSIQTYVHLTFRHNETQNVNTMKH